MQKHAVRTGRLSTGIASAALRLLLQYHWPGNVRELENAMGRAVLMEKSDVVQASSLPPEILRPLAVRGGLRRRRGASPAHTERHQQPAPPMSGTGKAAFRSRPRRSAVADDYERAVLDRHLLVVAGALARPDQFHRRRAHVIDVAASREDAGRVEDWRADGRVRWKIQPLSRWSAVRLP